MRHTAYFFKRSLLSGCNEECRRKFEAMAECIAAWWLLIFSSLIRAMPYWSWSYTALICTRNQRNLSVHTADRDGRRTPSKRPHSWIDLSNQRSERPAWESSTALDLPRRLAPRAMRVETRYRTHAADWPSFPSRLLPENHATLPSFHL